METLRSNTITGLEAFEDTHPDLYQGTSYGNRLTTNENVRGNINTYFNQYYESLTEEEYLLAKSCDKEAMAKFPHRPKLIKYNLIYFMTHRFLMLRSFVSPTLSNF